MSLQYQKVVGVGGIGRGMLFYTQDNRTLGRSESRLVELSDAKDYCKQHIVFYYISALLAPAAEIYPIGYVGKDFNGQSLRQEMQKQGMLTTYVMEDDALPTMLSICLQYPDKEGCNFTASNSACDRVSPEYVRECINHIAIGPKTMVVAIPEVRVESRLELLRLGRQNGAFCALSVPEAEADLFTRANAFANCDLLAVNETEAAAIAGCEEEGGTLAKRLYHKLCASNPNIMLLVTCGKQGAYSVYKGHIEAIPPFPATAVNTTGAGDACLGGSLGGLALGLPFQKGTDDSIFGETPLSSAVELGTICAGMAVESADSIALQVNKNSILSKISEKNWKVQPWFIK